LVLILTACLGDPVGPGTLTVDAVGDAATDTLWVGAPGEGIPGGVQLRVTDGAGRPVPGASLEWEAIGRDAHVLKPSTESNPEGLATAGWQLGTNASEEQLLRVLVRTVHHQSEILIRAHAVPHVVSQLRVLTDTPAVLRLGDTLPVRVDAVDPYGNAFPAPDLAVSIFDSTFGSVAGVSVIGGPRRGRSVVRVASHGVGVAFPLKVVQYPAAIIPVSDTIRFSSLGDTLPIAYVVRDDRGRLVADTSTTITVLDSTVARVTNGVVHSHLLGTTTLRLTLDSTVATVVVDVRQVVTTLTIAVAFDNPVLTFPVGAALPLTCRAFDRNGFPVPQNPTFVGSLNGTVTGSGCGDALVQRSGYDTLLFALGTAEARVPVIVATRPDSVGVLRAAQPLTDDPFIRYVGDDFSKPSIVALRPLVAEILQAYGNPSSNLDRAKAIRDWVARTALYHEPSVRPDESTSNLSVLPPGKTWADANANLDDSVRARDIAYWADIGFDGYAILNRLLGTLDPVSGLRADDGLMTHVGGALYRIKDLASYHFFLCGYQVNVLVALWAAAGLHGTQLQTVAHDPAAVFLPDLGRWVYEDPSSNNDYVLDDTGDPLSPEALLTLSAGGQIHRAIPMRIAGPNYDPGVYIQTHTYVGTGTRGFPLIGSRMYTYGTQHWNRVVVIDAPGLENYPPFNDESAYPRVSPEIAFPTLGVVVADLQVSDSVFVVRLGSNLPHSTRFQRRVQGGEWEPVQSEDVLPVGACRVEYRSVDALGNVSASAVLDVWAPRAPMFLSVGGSTTARRQSQLCI
jgi:hypothetical protein